MIKRAYVRIDVVSTLDDKTRIPNQITFSCGSKPDDENCIDYAVGSFVDEKQLQDIFNILMTVPSDFNCFSLEEKHKNKEAGLSSNCDFYGEGCSKCDKRKKCMPIENLER